jgi:hypothetical protein
LEILLQVDPLFVLICHWYVILLPVAVTFNVWFEASQTVADDGFDEMEGALRSVRVAAMEFSEGAQFDETTHLY